MDMPLPIETQLVDISLGCSGEPISVDPGFSGLDCCEFVIFC